MSTDPVAMDDKWSLSGSEVLSVADAVGLAGLLKGLTDQAAQDRDWYSRNHRSRRDAWRRS
jgi:hypothetical protein